MSKSLAVTLVAWKQVCYVHSEVVDVGDPGSNDFELLRPDDRRAVRFNDRGELEALPLSSPVSPLPAIGEEVAILDFDGLWATEADYLSAQQEWSERNKGRGHLRNGRYMVNPTLDEHDCIRIGLRRKL